MNLLPSKNKYEITQNVFEILKGEKVLKYWDDFLMTFGSFSSLDIQLSIVNCPLYHIYLSTNLKSGWTLQTPEQVSE